MVVSLIVVPLFVVLLIVFPRPRLVQGVFGLFGACLRGGETKTNDKKEEK